MFFLRICTGMLLSTFEYISLSTLCLPSRLSSQLESVLVHLIKEVINYNRILDIHRLGSLNLLHGRVSC
ncbi:hypothetical protein KC19_1G116600 [Ceratodon purpureus]|uniref:Maturase K n=1 Tax=Ceratodon purpureus TaxID=3225 RepID=A0A8T0J415_CERPU|nr:hypothetical protein KC19_1G116600 [Ceratodon purpureus]